MRFLARKPYKRVRNKWTLRKSFTVNCKNKDLLGKKLHVKGMIITEKVYQKYHKNLVTKNCCMENSVDGDLRVFSKKIEQSAEKCCVYSFADGELSLFAARHLALDAYLLLHEPHNLICIENLIFLSKLTRFCTTVIEVTLIWPRGKKFVFLKKFIFDQSGRIGCGVANYLVKTVS